MMRVQDVMTQEVQYIPADTSLKRAAEQMRELDCGFLPIADSAKDQLRGVITDRDIVTRAIAEGRDPLVTNVDEMRSDKVLYCFAEDDLEQAARSMREQQVYRLIVLDNPDNKNLCGIISLGDINRHHETQLAAQAAEGIAA